MVFSSITYTQPTSLQRITLKLQHYLKYKTGYELLFWLIFFIWQIVANVYVALDDNANSSFHKWEPVLWESSSTIVFVLMIPLILIFDRHFPIRFETLKTHLPLHIIATIPFSLIHVFSMVAMRETGYWYMDSDYNFGHWPSELLYEYAKDLRTYFYLLTIIYLYRLVLFRAQGEATVPALESQNSEHLQTEDSQSGGSLSDSSLSDSLQSSSPLPLHQHLLVKKLGKEFLVRIEEIEWLEACGNYVNLHVSGRAYPYRGTMKSLQEQLDPAQFLRVHRSYMVNYSQIQSIEPLESGDAKIQLRQGKELPFSRRYRADLKQAIT